MGVKQYDCGCRSDDRSWVVLCAQHTREEEELHVQALATYRAIGRVHDAATMMRETRKQLGDLL